MDIVKIIFTSIGSLAAMFCITRLIGNRQMSQMSMFDYVNGITIGSIAAEFATSLEQDFWLPLTAMAVYGLAAVAIAWGTCKSMALRRFFNGRPTVLFEHGKLYEQNLAAARMDINEFLTQCRAAGYFDLTQLDKRCEESGIRFIGPSSGVIKLMGDKASARELMKKAGVPVTPGSEGTVNDEDEAAEVAARIGYPVMIKASAGGGGRGMRKAQDEQELRRMFAEASCEAESCFGDGSIYIEKLISDPRHIEIQIIGDSFGNIVQLGDRDCSIQRRNQKMLEEAPAWGLDERLRTEMAEAAVKAAAAAGYESAGTVEFIVDKDENFYFIEMNTRIQVEHPVTEAVSGINIIREQLRIASGMSLSFGQEDVEILGHAIECRITAEKIFDDFAPCPGTVSFLHLPAGEGVRVDSALYSGCEISPYYDSMVAKVIVRGDSRLAAIRKMRRALGETVIEGVETTLPIQYLLMYDSDFIRGKYDTGFMDLHLGKLLSLYEEAGGRDESV